MDREYIRQRLPERTPKGLINWAERTQQDELGGDYIIFRGERVREQADIAMLMDNCVVGKTVWATRCTCTACREEFITQKVPGADAFRMIDGEDGSMYTAEPGVIEPGIIVEIKENDYVRCPLCDEKCKAVSAKSIRGGRTKRIRVCTLQNVEGRTAIIYYIISKHLTEYSCFYECEPEKAFVITERMTVVPYTHRRPGFTGRTVPSKEWQITGSRLDPWDSRYSDWGSWNNTKIGSAVYTENLPDMDGSTGEKTGILTWFKEGRCYPLSYYNLWRKRHNVEQLVLSGCAKLIEDKMLNSYSYDLVAEVEQFADLSKTKPHEILGLSKQAFKRIKETTVDALSCWKVYRCLGGKLNDIQFMELFDNVREYAMNDALRLMRDYGDEPSKVFAYLEKQNISKLNISLLADTRRFIRAVNGNITPEQMWPRNLRETHDRMAEAYRILCDKKKGKDLAEGFQKIVDELGAVQWTDGELCIVIPKCNGDLLEEGRILRHCVGGYGTSHIKKKHTIFFVRKYRRPERSYYTLDINLEGQKPIRQQLHGYGNEMHGDKKQYRHSIPQKVIDFCNRWQTEILEPWWHKQYNSKKETA